MYRLTRPNASPFISDIYTCARIVVCQTVPTVAVIPDSAHHLPANGRSSADSGGICGSPAHFSRRLKPVFFGGNSISGADPVLVCSVFRLSSPLLLRYCMGARLSQVSSHANLLSKCTLCLLSSFVFCTRGSVISTFC